MDIFKKRLLPVHMYNRMALISIAYGITADGEFHKDLTVLHNRISFS